MKILLITHFFPPKHTGGTEIYTLGLAKALLHRGHEVQVICAADWETGDRYWNGVTEDVYDGVVVHRIHLTWGRASDPNKMLYDSLPVEKWLDDFLPSFEPDLVHVTSLVSLGVGVIRSVHRARIPLVLTLTDFWFLCPSLQLLRSHGSLCDGRTTPLECQACLSVPSRVFQSLDQILPGPVRAGVWGGLSRIPAISRQDGLRGHLLNMAERKQVLVEALGMADRIFTPSRFVQTMFAHNTSIQMEVLPHGHELSWLSQYTEKTPSPVVRFGYTGQIQPTKGVHVLIEAFKAAGLEGRARLDIWGNLDRQESYINELAALADGHPSISLCGPFERSRLGAVLSEIDVLVVPSVWYENAPLVIQEAFAARTPVIASNLGGMAEAVSDGVSGLLFERGDVQDLARQLQRIVHEPDLLEKLRAGIRRVKTFDEELNQLEEVYGSLIAHR